METNGISSEDRQTLKLYQKFLEAQVMMEQIRKGAAETATTNTLEGDDARTKAQKALCILKKKAA